MKATVFMGWFVPMQVTSTQEMLGKWSTTPTH